MGPNAMRSLAAKAPAVPAASLLDRARLCRASSHWTRSHEIRAVSCAAERHRFRRLSFFLRVTNQCSGLQPLAVFELVDDLKEFCPPGTVVGNNCVSRNQSFSFS